MSEPAWTLEQGLEVCRQLQPALVKLLWNVSLGGGVLYRGSSDKDLDLVFFPYGVTESGRPPYIYRVADHLEGLGWVMTHTATQMQAYWRKQGKTDMKHVEVWRLPDGRRVDAIILGGRE